MSVAGPVEETHSTAQIGPESGRGKQDVVQVAVVGLILVALVCAAFNSMPQHKFVMLDDGVYLATNHNLDGGLTWENVKWAFSDSHMLNYHPVTWISFLADVSLYGMNPYPQKIWTGGFKVTNLVLHVASTAILYLLLLRMTNLLWPSALVALLFGIHPLHVESVAWATERKDVLSTFFVLLAMGAYVRYAGCGSIFAYVLMLIFYVLSLLSKQMYVTLPGVLILLDYWPLRRVGWASGEVVAESGFSRVSWIRAILEKVPIAILAVGSAGLIYAIQAANPAVYDLRPPLEMRVPNALHSYGVYLVQTFWPVHLSFFYPYPREPYAWYELAWPAGLLVGISLVAILMRRRWPYLIVGWLWYLGTLLPVIGLVQVGWQAHADRYMYFPIIGIFIGVVYGMESLVRRMPTLSLPMKAIQVGAAAICLYLTVRQVGRWQDSQSLSRYGASVDAKNYLAWLQMGTFDGQNSDWEKSVENLRRARDLCPEYYNARLNLGITEAALGNSDAAREEFVAISEIAPKSDEAHFQIGVIDLGKGDVESAIERFETVLGLNPRRLQAEFLLGLALVKKGDFSGAKERFEKIGVAASEKSGVRSDASAMLRLLEGIAAGDAAAVAEYKARFNYPPTYSGSLLRFRGAYSKYRRALQFRRLGFSELARELHEQAKRDFEKSAELWSGNFDAYYNLGVMLANEERFAESIEAFQKAIKLNPDHELSRVGLKHVMEMAVGGALPAADFELEIAGGSSDRSPFEGMDLQFDPAGDPNLYQDLSEESGPVVR